MRVLLAVVAGLPGLVAGQSDARGPSPARAMVLRDEGYVGSEACRECHAENHASWSASFHRSMTQDPTPASVLAPFEGTTPVLDGVAWKLAREDEVYTATPVGPFGTPLGRPARVALTTGSHHYQVYWMVSPAGELEQIPLLWDVAGRRWIPRRSTFLSPEEGGFGTDGWQQVCIKCHATNGTPVHRASGTTKVAELGIACEACHGPGAAHVEWRQRPEAEHEPEPATGIVDPSELDPAREAQVCGQCHGTFVFAHSSAHENWLREGFAYRPGDELWSSRSFLRGRTEQNGQPVREYLARTSGHLGLYFWSDGQVRVAGREYNGLVESPCYLRGQGEQRMTCLSCHELHASPERVAAGWAADQLRVGMDGPEACLGCHAAYREPAALRAHTHHAEGSSGADCLNCHMPYTSYGLVKAIRSHTLTSPSAAESTEVGRPNACNLCHLDRSLGWTARHLFEWYGQKPPALTKEQETTSAVVQWALAGDAGQRALAAAALGWEPARAVSGTGWMPPLLSTLLMDEYDAVRLVAERSVRSDPRWAHFALDPCGELEEQRNHVRATVLSDWLQAGLQARSDQREAVLVLPTGKLDEPRFRALHAARDHRPVTLVE
ncbi:MAG TPA: cytochrome c3 family protein [Planctomycetota bacterium]